MSKTNAGRFFEDYSVGQVLDHAVPIRKEVSALVATLVVFAIVSGIHAWLGYNPFG